MPPFSWRVSWIVCLSVAHLFTASLCLAEQTSSASDPIVPLFLPVEVQHEAPEHLMDERKQWIRLTDAGLKALKTSDSSLELRLLDGESEVAEPSNLLTHPSHSTSWIGNISGQPAGSVVLVSREGVLIGSIRTQSGLYMVAYSGSQGLHILYEVDETLPKYQEQEPTPISADDPRLQESERQRGRHFCRRFRVGRHERLAIGATFKVRDPPGSPAPLDKGLAALEFIRGGPSRGFEAEGFATPSSSESRAHRPSRKSSTTPKACAISSPIGHFSPAVDLKLQTSSEHDTRYGQSAPVSHNIG